jgi:hypothetical protein
MADNSCRPTLGWHLMARDKVVSSVYRIIPDISHHIQQKKISSSKKQTKLLINIENAKTIANHAQYSRIAVIERFAWRHQCFAEKLLAKMRRTLFQQQRFFQTGDLVRYCSQFLNITEIHNLIRTNHVIRKTVQKSLHYPVLLYTIIRFLQTYKNTIQSLYLEPNKEKFYTTYKLLVNLATKKKIPIQYGSYETFLTDYDNYKCLIMPAINLDILKDYDPAIWRPHRWGELLAGITAAPELLSRGINLMNLDDIYRKDHFHHYHYSVNPNLYQPSGTSDQKSESLSRLPMKFQYSKFRKPPKIRNLSSHFTKIRRH